MTNEDLKARLRDTACQGVELAIKNGRYVSPHEAADHIERLEADNARLRGANQAAAECVAAMMEECARYRDEIRAALQEISHD